MSGDDMKPGEIGRLFGDLKAQLAQVSEDIRAMRVDVQTRFEGLEQRYASKAELSSEMRLLSLRQDGYEHQSDIATAAYDAELRSVREELAKSAEERRNTRRVAWSAVLGVLSTVISAIAITLLNVHS